MKRGKLLFFGLTLVVLINLSFVNGACINPSDTILKIYSGTNAHGALWNQSYSYDICYNATFGTPYVGNPRTCTGGNNFLFLSAINNAHVSLTQSATYPIAVCYGNLICRNVTDPIGCASDENVTARLYQNSNTHISNSSDTNYPIKICCKPAAPSSGINNARWTNLINNNQISSADLNDDVRLYVEGVGFTGQVNYTIYKDNSWWFDKKVAVQTSSTGYTIWNANFSGTYYFIAKVDGIAGEKKSDDLVVSGILNNSNPVAVITGPEDRQMYFLGTNLNFTQASYDEDNIFNYEWNLGDGRIFTGNSLNLGNWSFVKNYSAPAQKNIILAVNDGRGGVGRDQISILILNSSYVLAYVDSPRWGASEGRIVNFNASGSYAAGYNHTTQRTTCLGGKCPLETKNDPVGVSNYNRTTLGIIGNPSYPDYGKLVFNWTFVTGRTGAESKESSVHDYLITKTFESSFPGLPNTARLKVIYD